MQRLGESWAVVQAELGHIFFICEERRERVFSLRRLVKRVLMV